MSFETRFCGAYGDPAAALRASQISSFMKDSKGDFFRDVRTVCTSLVGNVARSELIDEDRPPLWRRVGDRRRYQGECHEQTGEASRFPDCTWFRASKRVVCGTFGRVVVHPFEIRNPP
jgi:hypothetical protein